MCAETLKLASDFPTPSEAQWRDLVAKALNGGDFEKHLVSKSADRLAIAPLYPRRHDGAPISGETAGRPWRISARVDHPRSREACAQALEDLKNGVDSLTLVFPGSLSARGYGMTCDTVADLDAALDGVALEMIALRLDPAPMGRINAALVAALVEKRGLNPAACTIDFGMDPIGNLAYRGVLVADWPTVGQRLTDAVQALGAKGFMGPFLNCDTRPFHEAGASEGQELAVALATGVAYLRALTDSGLSGAEASKAISFTLAIDPDQFLGMAKIRALRRLWARIEEASGISPQPIRINAETAWRMLTRRDPWVNMLRATMATFIAGVGGADSMTVLPHTLALGLPDGFARRVARNTQSVLLEESNLWRVADPAAGAGGYEALSDELAAAAWTLFQEIEMQGGMVASLGSAHIQSKIRAVREAREEAIARRRIAITGTSEFPLLGEGGVDVLDVAADPSGGIPARRDDNRELAFADLVGALVRGATRGEVTPGPVATTVAEALPSVRLAAPFENLRDKAQAYKQRTGAYPQVFLASLGPIAAHTARSTWIRNLLAAGGIEALTTEGYASAELAASAFKASGAKLACICSSDDIYAEVGAQTATALKAAGAGSVLLAGRPGALEAVLKDAGVDTFVFAGQDMLAFLTQLQRRLLPD
ncbi:MAG: methylmalonyl-CoA mutase subunit beta [Alphaproteobacteria bacterium]|nr:methylmalonyl-CoA mutase subunit beta [Alphaproteobacteria bacterium]